MQSKTTEFTPPHRLDTPVLFLVFNRPDTTRQVFDAIRKAQPPRLYIAADGPRANREGEAERCEQVRNIATQVDWDCEVKTLFREENLGCKYAVSGGIDWFFENEEMGIILEDDCLPTPSWFPFAAELLNKYRDDERIMTISADYFHGAALHCEHSYFFSIYQHCWGWASWRRAWNLYDVEMQQWPAFQKQKQLKQLGLNHKPFESYWSRHFQQTYDGLIDTWDHQWTFACWQNHGLNIIPTRNLVKNIGFGKEATHTTTASRLGCEMQLEEIQLPLKHPAWVLPSYEADIWINRNIKNISWVNHFKQLIKENIFAKNTKFLVQ